MKVNLAYGQGVLPVELPDNQTTVIQPAHTAGLENERAAVLAALENPIEAQPLREWIHPNDAICIVFTDLTRATPNDRLIPWLLELLGHVRPEQVTLLNATGTHRPNTPAELEKLLTPAIVRKYRVINHESEKAEDLVQLGTTRNGAPALINRHLVEADVRIITGFIEPHFFAGFSGGPKGIMPGVAGMQTVMSNHGFKNLNDPQATFGITAGNPLWEELRDIALRVGPSFLLNVALNEQRQITGVFAGHLLEAHKHGTEFVRQSAMQKVETSFDMVVTTNSGYPLDLNLYQGVKGMCAAARILKPGGTMVLACECREGVPANSPFDKLLKSVRSPAEILDLLGTPGCVRAEQWQAHLLAIMKQRYDVLIHSSLTDEVARGAFLTPCHDIAEVVKSKLAALGAAARLAVLPQGPLTIPYLAAP